MSVEVTGFAPSLAARLRSALGDAEVTAPLRLIGCPLYNLGAQARGVDAALADNQSPVLALWAPGLCWLVRGAAQSACFHCLQLWRLHGWNIGFTRRELPDSLESHSPLVENWLAAVIATAAASLAGAPAQPDHAVAWLASSDHRTVSAHRFVRHPDCPRCTPLPDNSRASAEAIFAGDDAAARGLRAASLAQMAAAVLPAIRDARTGLIRRIAPRSGTPLLGMRSATLYPFKDPATVEEGFGRSGRAGDDAVIAVLEGLERFAGMRPRGQRGVMRGSYAALRGQAADPESFILHAPEQRGLPGFSLAEYSPDTVYDWVWGYSFRRDGGVLVPLQLAYFGLGRQANVTGGRFVYEISNGCALGASPTEASLHGLLETIERDAFLASWHASRLLDRVDIHACPDPFVQAMLARLGAEGLEVDGYDIRCGLPPAAFAVRIRDPQLRLGPAALYAAGASLHRDGALRAALGEAVTFVYRHGAEEIKQKMHKAEQLLDDPAGVRSMADHGLQCWPERALAERSFDIAAAAPLPWSALPAPQTDERATAELLRELVDATLAVAEDVIAVDQGFAPWRARGVHCMKVLAPGLLPMTFGQQHRRLSAARLRQVSGRDGGFRDDPHIFP